MLTSLKSSRWLDILWLLGLAIFVFAGMPLTTFHGDEAMQIYMSHDYATAFIYGEPQRLMSDGPYYVDDDVQLRLINGSVNRYAIGLSWHLAGFTNGDLPPKPGWDWGQDYNFNVETGHRSPDALLYASRVSSTLFLALSVAVMFGIGWQLRGRTLAYVASGLYAVNPVVLLNGRRAMMEGSLLFFGLLAIFFAIVISRKRSQGKAGHIGWWIGLVLASALCLASKHSGLVFVGGAFGWILLTSLIDGDRRAIPVVLVQLAAGTALVLLLFFALSPALWYEPMARVDDLLQARSALIDIQVQADPAAPTTLGERIGGIITEPFIETVWHFEAGGWTDFTPIQAEVSRYMASPLSGLQFGPILGGILTLLSLLGLIDLLRQWRGFRIGLLAWLGLTLAMLLVNPLPWQRYYLPLIPISTLLAGAGALAIVRLAQRRAQAQSSPDATFLYNGDEIAN